MYKKKNNFALCGLVGFSGKEDCSIDKIKTLLMYNESRGKDSSGIYLKGKSITKSIGKVSETLLPKYIFSSSNMVIAHTRHGTVGTVSEENAHPFQIGQITGAHNGTIDNFKEIAAHHSIEDTLFSSDSKVIFLVLEKTKEAKTVFENYSGSAAIIYTDGSGLLYVYKDKERPLFRGVSKEGLYISSIESSLFAIDCESIKKFKDNVLYTIENGKIIKSLRISRNKQIEKKRIEKEVYSHHNNYRGYDRKRIGYKQQNDYQHNLWNNVYDGTIDGWDKPWIIAFEEGMSGIEIPDSEITHFTKSPFISEKPIDTNIITDNNEIVKFGNSLIKEEDSLEDRIDALETLASSCYLSFQEIMEILTKSGDDGNNDIEKMKTSIYEIADITNNQIEYNTNGYYK